MQRSKTLHIALALLLTASLFTASATACTCDDEHGSVAAAAECYVDEHAAAGAGETTSSVADSDDGCGCCADLHASAAISKPFTAIQGSADTALSVAWVIPNARLEAGTDSQRPALFAVKLSHSILLTSHLPSRAPPRL